MATREGQLLKSVSQIQWFIVHSVFSKYPAQILWNERTVDLSFGQCKQPWSRVNVVLSQILIFIHTNAHF